MKKVFATIMLAIIASFATTSTYGATVIFDADASLANMNLTDQRAGSYTDQVTGPSATWTAGFSVKTAGGEDISFSNAFFSVNGGGPVFITGLNLTAIGGESSASPYFVAYSDGVRIETGTVGAAEFDEFYIGGVGNGGILTAGASNRTVSFGAIFDPLNSPSPSNGTDQATYVVPEPGAVALATLGATVFMLRRRRGSTVR